MADLRYYLLLDHIKIHGANAISSPLTYGFPAISGFVGAIHALTRKIESDERIYLDGVMIACHQCDVQIYRPHQNSDYTFKLTRNPIGKDGKTRSIIEEGKVHLDISLVVEVICQRDALDDEDKQQAFEQQIRQKLMQQRMAGGSVLAIGSVHLYKADSEESVVISRLIPGFVLVNAQQDLIDITAELQQRDANATQLDALIETAKLHHQPPEGEEKEWKTTTVKRGRGWLVPITIGYQAISPIFSADKVSQSRSSEYETQYVEAIYGLGKWVFPNRLEDDFKQTFWRYSPAKLQENKADLYLFTNKTIHQENTEY